GNGKGFKFCDVLPCYTVLCPNSREPCKPSFISLPLEINMHHLYLKMKQANATGTEAPAPQPQSSNNHTMFIIISCSYAIQNGITEGSLQPQGRDAN
ncbi:hypothetical protein DVH24_019671, partial [Malus domestica]